MPPLREIRIDTPIGAIAALRGGDPAGPRVLALHGWLDNAASFLPLAPWLAACDLVAIDLPGHGRSPHLPAGADYSFFGAVNAVLDVADALEWPSFRLLAHSMGAGIGSLIAASCPDRVQRFVAIEALGALSEAPERTATRMREAVAALRALPGKSLRVFPDPELAIRARMQANALSEAAAGLLVERGTQATEGGWIWSSDPRLTTPSFTRLTEPQVADLVAGIGCPVLVIHADPAQPYLPDALRHAHAALLRYGELWVLPGTHHLHMEDAATLGPRIAAFLRDD